MTDERIRLIRLLNEIFDWNFNPNVVDMVDTTRLADCLLSNGVTLQRWIPVTERLPKKRGFVLGFTRDKVVGELHWDKDEGFVWAGSDEDAEPVAVTHWMPLPTPPKEE